MSTSCLSKLVCLLVVANIVVVVGGSLADHSGEAYNGLGVYQDDYQRPLEEMPREDEIVPPPPGGNLNTYHSPGGNIDVNNNGNGQHFALKPYHHRVGGYYRCSARGLHSGHGMVIALICAAIYCLLVGPCHRCL